jgi:hypothetical protein
MASETTQARHQTTRTVSQCRCGGPCFYCRESLIDVAHEHDHFPVAHRHGGRLTVPACKRCHRIKEREFLHVWSPAALGSLEEGLTWQGRLMMFTMLSRLRDEPDPDWSIAGENDPSALILQQVEVGCTTTEARLALAQGFDLLADRYPPAGSPLARAASA